jgi:hypothetical protein
VEVDGELAGRELDVGVPGTQSHPTCSRRLTITAAVAVDRLRAVREQSVALEDDAVLLPLGVVSDPLTAVDRTGLERRAREPGREDDAALRMTLPQGELGGDLVDGHNATVHPARHDMVGLAPVHAGPGGQVEHRRRRRGDRLSHDRTRAIHTARPVGDSV